MTALEVHDKGEPVSRLAGPRLVRLPLWGWDYLRNGEDTVDRLFNTYGDVFSLSLPRFIEVLPGVSEIVFVREPTLIKALFTAPDEQVDSTQANRILEMLYGDKSLFLIDGTEHLRLRKILLPRLRGGALEKWRAFIVESTEREVRTWINEDSVRIHPRMLELSLELILKISLGVTDEAMPLWKPPFSKLLELAVSEEMAVRYGMRRLGGLKRWGKFQRVLHECNTLVFDEITKRRRSPDQDRLDLLDLLMRAEGEPLSDKELRDQIFTVLIAGHETSATTASWAVERLLRTPVALEKATLEARGGDERRYLEAVVHETLRLRPPVAGVGRVTRQPVSLGSYRFPAKVLIVPLIRSVHRSHQLYDDPESFVPQRFLDTKPGVYTLIPFGGGRPRCLGDRLALFQTSLVLQTILRTADLSAVKPHDEDIKRKAIAYVPGDGALVRARPTGEAR